MDSRAKIEICRSLVNVILRDPGADSGVRESRNWRKKNSGRRHFKVKGWFALDFSLPTFFSPVLTFPRPNICPWVSEVE